MGQLSLRRYEIRRELGRGGTGTVYEALDTKTQAVVALKTVETALAENLFRLKHEFRVLADVQHQNLVHFGELACEEGKWFFTMELVSGYNFIDYVRPDVVPTPAPVRAASGSIGEDMVTQTVLRALAVGTQVGSELEPVPARGRRGGPTVVESRLRATLAQLVEALSALHEAGHIHRDVKPANVMVSREGRLVLLDFGLVLALAGGDATAADRMGTPSYMAPEQIEGLPIGPAADWYAVGSMLFVALTGQLPFAASLNVLEAKLYHDAPAPHEIVAGVPADLDQLCVDLLRRTPGERPDEDEIRARLQLPPRVRISDRTASPAEAPTPFVGRLVEQAALAAAFRDVRAGQPRAVVIEGEPGVGKTALVNQFLAELEPRPLVLAGRCYEQESVPFKGVDTIIDALSEHLLTLRDDEVTALCTGGVRYLATVFPVLRRVPAIQAALPTERAVASQAGLREHAFGECARLFAALAHERPLVIFLDDLQWVDADSMALLERSVLPLSGTPGLFLSTLRTGVELPGPVAQLRTTAQRLEVSGLSEDESRTLWDTLRHADPEETSRLGERTAALREAGGHPLFLAELARAARTGRFENRHAGALLDVLRDRIEHHDPVERAFLEATAVAGAPTPYQIVARAADLDVGECHARIGGLKAAQLLKVTLIGDERCVETYHDRIREALMEPLHADPVRTRGLQLRLGRALLDEPAGDDAVRERIFTIVQHFNAARALITDGDERMRVARLDLIASREARLATAYDRARDYARVGLELAGDDCWQRDYALCRDLHVARMEAEHLAGDRDAARAVFETVRLHLTSAADTAALWSSWIVLETGKGRFREAIAAGREGLRELGAPIPEPVTKMTVLRQYAATRWAQRGRPLRALEALPPLTDVRRRGALGLLMSIGPVAFFVDTHLMSWLNMRIAAESMRHGLSAVAPFGFAGHGIVLAGVFGRHAEADAFGQLALRINEQLGNEQLAAKLYVQNGAFITHWVRPFADAKALLRTAGELAVKHGDAAYEVYAATILSVVTFCESSDLAAVQETGIRGRDVGARRKIKDMAAVPDLHARYAEALRGQTDSWTDLGRPSSSDAELRATLGDDTTPVGIFYYHFCNAELAYLAGDIDRAAALLEVAEKRTKGIFAIPTTVELCFLGALVAAQQYGRAAGWRDRLRLRRAITRRIRKLDAWARSCPHNYEAHALIAHAELARARGRARQADMQYQRAIASARRINAPKREALALELAAAHALAQGDHDKAAAWRRQAIEAYRRWGAVAKADALERIS